MFVAQYFVKVLTQFSNCNKSLWTTVMHLCSYGSMRILNSAYHGDDDDIYLE